PQSLILLMTRLGMNVRLTHPPEFKLMPDIVAQAQENAKKAHSSLEILDDFDAGFKDADVLLPKSWGAMMTTTDNQASAQIAAKYTDWIADERRMALAKDHAIYMHPLPADRDIEVASAVLDGPQSRAWDQAENRLHAQKAVMALTMR
ncbi:MAG: ornithine carbamoyltransferase, partial [Anaerolineae bacterium]|nr:ornithine carbamoyltransferase [Anaerolineae bacterium]